MIQTTKQRSFIFADIEAIIKFYLYIGEISLTIKNPPVGLGKHILSDMPMSGIELGSH